MKKLSYSSLFIIIVGIVLVIGGTFAIFTSVVTNSNNFTTGKISIKNLASSKPLSLTKYFNNMLPGDSEVFEVKVLNDGSLDAKVKVKELKNSGRIFEGSTPLQLSVVDNTYKVIKPGETASFDIKYLFPLEADNSYQGVSGTSEIVIIAEQYRNNAGGVSTTPIVINITPNPITSPTPPTPDITVIPLPTAAPQMPDLRVERVYYGPVKPSTYNDIKITAVIQNAGNVVAPASLVLIKSNSETEGMIFEVRELNPGEKVEITRTGKLAAGVHRVNADVDYVKQINESNDSNNTNYVDINVSSSKPDLIVEKVSFSPENPSENEDTTFTAVIANIGNASSPASKATLRVGGESFPRKFEIPNLQPGQKHTVTRTMKLDGGIIYRTKVIADSDGIVVEESEDNNSGYVDISVLK